MVVFTLFTGVDPHVILLQAATNKSMDVYLGLPRAPARKPGQVLAQYTQAYLEFVRRFLVDQAFRSGAPPVDEQPSGRVHATHNSTRLKGYFIGDEAQLFDLTNSSHNDVIPTSPDVTNMLTLYARLGALIRSHNRTAMVMTSIDLRRRLNHTVAAHVAGFEALVKSRAADVIAVSEVSASEPHRG